MLNMGLLASVWLVECPVRARESKDRRRKTSSLKVMVAGPAQGLPISIHPFSLIVTESLLLRWAHG